MLTKGAKPRPEDIITPEEEIKDPVVLEFLDLKDEYSESDLEEALLKQLENFLLELGNTVWPESRTIDIVRTQGNEDESGLKRLISKHLQKTRKYYVDPEEIHFITEKKRAKYEALTA